MILLRALALGACCCVASGSVANSTPRTIRVVVDSDYAPYSFVSDDGRLQGILIDQWRAWERVTGINAEIRGMDWGEALRRMRAGEFDVIDSIIATRERRAYFDFTEPFASVGGSIYFRKDISGIADLASLKGFPVGVKAGDQHIDVLEENGASNLVAYKNNMAIVEAAKERAISIFVADDPSAMYLLHKMGLEGDFRHSAPMFQDDLRRAVRKGDTATLAAVNAGFAAIDRDDLDRIERKWLGSAIDSYRPYLVALAYAATAAAVLLLSLAFWNRALRRAIALRTAEIRALSEQREADLRLAIDSIPAMAWSLRADGGLDFINRRWLEYTGLSLGEALKDPAGTIHPDELPRVLESWRGRISTGEPYEEEMRLRRADGEYRWFLVRTVPLRNERGEVIKWFGSSTDIEDRKQASDAVRENASELRAMSRRLVELQESERRNLSRELHDRIGQNLTALKIDLAILESAILEHGNGNVRARLDDASYLLESTIRTIDDVTSELRPRLLDAFGLAAALERHAEEFSARTGIAVSVTAASQRRAPPHVEIALFRIAQEALNNVAKHAGARHVRVVLDHANRECAMSVEDDGIGFDGFPEVPGKGRPRLGMVTMRERAEAVGGRFEAGRGPSGGTRLTVHVPL